MKKAVLFDLDDTLIEEDNFIQSGYRKIAEYLVQQYGFQPQGLYEELYALYLDDAKNVFNRIMEVHGVTYTNENIMELVQLYRTHLPEITFYEDVIPVLSALRQKNIKLGIISDGYYETQKNKLSVLGANTFFDKIIITDELGRDYWKPDPRSFLMMRDCFGLDFSEMIYVGDNPEKDFYIGLKYPILTVRINRETSIYRNRTYKDGVKEKIEISTLEELLQLIEDKNYE